MSKLLLFLILFAANVISTVVAQSPSLDLDDLRDVERAILIQSGELPILISAPHGGKLNIQGVDPRSGEGLPVGPSGFFTGRDSGTQELGEALLVELKRRLGKTPYGVISAVHRKYLDPNRPSDIAFDSSKLQVLYDRYHHSLQAFVAKILEEHHAGLLIDLHGQGSKRDTVYRGTANGQTTRRLRERFGSESTQGQASLFGMLKKRGWIVFPDPLEGREQSGFTGGYIVRTYGSHQPIGIDAWQLELGSDFRSRKVLERVVCELADAIAEYHSLYLTPHPAP